MTVKSSNQKTCVCCQIQRVRAMPEAEIYTNEVRSYVKWRARVQGLALNRVQGRATTQDSSSCTLPHNLSVICNPQVYSAQPAQLDKPCSEACCFCVLGTGAMVHRGYDLQARMSNFFLISSLSSSEPVSPFYINSLIPSQYYLCA